MVFPHLAIHNFYCTHSITKKEKKKEIPEISILHKCFHIVLKVQFSIRISHLTVSVASGIYGLGNVLLHFSP